MLTSAKPAAAEPEEIVIAPLRPNFFKEMAEIFRYRRLIASMTRGKLQNTYARSRLGVLWVLARPLAMLGIFTFIRHASSANMGVSIPYPLYLYSGLIFWFFFVTLLDGATTALQRDASLIRKVYFPPLVSPLVSACVEFVNLLVAFLPLPILMFVFGVFPGVNVWYVFVAALQLALLAIGFGALFAVLTINSDDWKKAIGIALYLGIFVSPVIYSPDMIPEPLKIVFHLNPASGPLLAVRAGLFAPYPPPGLEFVYSGVVSVLAFLIGLLVFQRHRHAMLDRL